MTKTTRFMPWTVFIVSALMFTSLFLIFWRTPSEQQMGVVYKIFYFHVGSAMSSLLLFLGCSICSLGFLLLRTMRGMSTLAAQSDRLAHAMAEVGLMFGLIVLIKRTQIGGWRVPGTTLIVRLRITVKHTFNI